MTEEGRRGSVFEALIRWMLRLYPREFRESFGPDLLEAMNERLDTCERWSLARAAMKAKEGWAVLKAVPAARVQSRPVMGYGRRRGDRMVRLLAREVRDAARALARARLFSGVAVVTLALGIGAAGAVTNLARGVLVSSLPYPAPDELVLIWSTDLQRDIQRWQVTVADFLDWRERSRTVVAMAPYRAADYNLAGEDSPERVAAYRVGVDLFRVLGVIPALGRGFLPEEESPSSPRVALLSHGLWRSRFGADPDVLGTTIHLDDVPHTVTGVLPPGASFPVRDVDLWVPLRFDPEGADRVSRAMSVVGRLAPGVTTAQAREEMTALARALAEEYPETNSATGAWVAPLKDELVRGTSRRILVLVGAVTLLLVVTCANLMGLFLIRWTDRRADLAVRTALGASRLQQFRMLLTESVILGLAGGGCGLLVATALTRVTVRFVPSSHALEGATGLTPWLTLTTLAASVITVGFFGVGPSLGFSRAAPVELLRHRRTGPSIRTRRIQGALVVGEVALALALAVGSGLLFRSFQRLSDEELGFNPERAHVGRMEPPACRYSEPGALTRMYEAVLGRVHALPGVTAAGFVSYAPLTGSGGMVYYEPPGSEEREGPPDLVYIRMVTPRYYEAVGASLASGRSFEPSDRAGAPLVAVVNEAFVSRYLAGNGPTLGAELPLEAFGASVRVVGVVRDIRYVGVDSDPWPEICLHEAQIPAYTFFTPRDLVVRTTEDVPAPATALREVVASVDPALPLFNVRTLRAVVGAGLERPRFQLRLFGGFAMVALFLSCLGIFAVVQYSVQSRSREIGVRMALGAGSGSVRWEVLRRGTRLVSTGVLIGVGGAVALGRLLEGILYETDVRDPLTFATTIVLVAGAGILASYLPSRRATQVDPLTVLREE